jgi:hypothetical protein
MRTCYALLSRRALPLRQALITASQINTRQSTYALAGLCCSFLSRSALPLRQAFFKVKLWSKRSGQKLRLRTQQKEEGRRKKNFPGLAQLQSNLNPPPFSLRSRLFRL